MPTDAYIKSLKIGDKKRHADLYGLVLELRPTKKNKDLINYHLSRPGVIELY